MRINHLRAAAAVPLLILTAGCSTQVADAQKNAAGSIADAGPSDIAAGSIADAGPSDIADGTVKWFDPARGYGFIDDDDDDGGTVFVFWRDIRTGSKMLLEGQRVDYHLISGPKGPQATEVAPVD